MKLHRCPECHAIDIRESVRHLLRYLYSARYRRALRKAQEEAAFWRKLTERPQIAEGDSLTWEVIDLTQLTAD